MKWRMMAFLSMLLTASARHATASSCRQSRARIRRLSSGFLRAASSPAAGAKGRHSRALLPRLLVHHAPWPSSLHSSTTIGANQRRRTLVSMAAAAGRAKGSKKSAEPMVVVPGRYRGVALEDLQAPAEIKQEVRDLARELEAHDDLYYNKDEPQITDAEYDGLAQRLEVLEREHPALVQELQAEEGYVSRADRVGAAPPAAAVAVGGAGVEVGARFAPVTHGWPMMSLDNAFSGEDVEAWAVRLGKVLKEEGEEEVVAPKDEDGAAATASRPLDFVAEVKIDGVSLSLRYEDGVLVRGATRGNGFVGEDVTANVQAIASIPKRLPSSSSLPPSVMEVRGEVYLSRQVFEELNEARAAQGAPLLSNPRNAASGSLRQLEPTLTRERRLGFFAYAAETDTPSLPSSSSFPTTQGAILTQLESWGFEVAKPWARCQGTEDLQQFHRRIEGERASLGFDVDGVVYKLDDLSSRATAGRSARAPRWALAHKFSPVEAQTRVRSVEVQVGRTGILTPVALLEPVTVGGVVISRATLHNFQDLARRDVRVGDIVAVRRAGDVIPQVLGRANVTAVEGGEEEGRPEPVVPPSVCPSCGGPVRVEEDMVGIYCPAGLSCPAQSLERLAHFASRDAFDIKGLGGRRVEELVGWGLLPSGPVDLFHLEEREEAKRKKMEEKIAAAAAGEGGEEGEGEEAGEGVWLLEEREGWGTKSVTALFSAIAARRSVPLSRFIFGLGVTHVGLTTAQAIARHFGSAANWWRAMQELEKEVEKEVEVVEEEEEEEGVEEEEVLEEDEADDGDDDDGTTNKKKKKKAAAKKKPKKKAAKPKENAGGLETIEGIGPTVIGSLRAFVRDERNRRTVEALMQEVQVTSERGQGQGHASEGGEAGGMVVPTEGPLVGKTVLFTGTLDSMTRSEAEARARQLGAKPVKALSKKVDMVVVGADPGGKVRKARELKVALLDEVEWQALAASGSES